MTKSYYREPVDNSVQLFDLGALYFCGRRGLFVLRFLLAKPDKKVFLFLWSQPPYRGDPDTLRSESIVNDYVAEA